MEWGEKITSICSVQVFKFITNPLYFSAQKKRCSGAMLFRLQGFSRCGDSRRNRRFHGLLQSLKVRHGRDKREIARETQKQQNRGIPVRIDERKRVLPEAVIWMLLFDDLNTKKSQLSDIEKAIADKSQAYKNASDTRLKLQQKLSNLRQEKQNREFKIKESVQSDYYAECKSQRELNDNLSLSQNELSRVRSEMQGYQKDLEALKAKREALIAEWREIKARTLQFKDDEFICPTCKRPLDIDDIERKQNEMTANFNTKKASDLEENNRKGQQVKKNTQETEALIKKCEERISELESRIETIKNNPLYIKSIVAPDAAPAIAADEEIKKLSQEIAELEETVNTPIDVPDTAELNEQKKSITDEIDAIKAKLAKKETIERNEARIKELEKQLREQSEELAQLEGIEFTMAAFSKARIEAVENRINGLFSLVKFKMFEQQINGGEVETCEATVNGVPYSDLNNAMTINQDLTSSTQSASQRVSPLQSSSIMQKP
jgi:chromosome segregation ATPase